MGSEVLVCRLLGYSLAVRVMHRIDLQYCIDQLVLIKAIQISEVIVDCMRL